MSSRRRAAAAGAGAAAVWGVLEPLDQRLLRCDYSDVAVLGQGVTRGRPWRLAGFAFDKLRKRVRMSPRRLGVGLALAEHLSLYPLCYFIDRHHPARGEPGVPPLLGNPRAFAQATWRHAVFGTVLGRLAV